MNKYGNKKTIVDGIKFDSKAEARRWGELALLVKAGAISRVELQPVYVLAPGVKFDGDARAKPELRYRADFAYVEFGLRVVEDVKGVETEAFRIKRHLMKWLHGIDVRVVK
jgi:hypothetical protein